MAHQDRVHGGVVLEPAPVGSHQPTPIRSVEEVRAGRLHRSPCPVVEDQVPTPVHDPAQDEAASGRVVWRLEYRSSDRQVPLEARVRRVHSVALEPRQVEVHVGRPQSEVERRVPREGCVHVPVPQQSAVCPELDVLEDDGDREEIEVLRLDVLLSTTVRAGWPPGEVPWF